MTHRSNQLKSCSRYRRPREILDVLEFSERSAARSHVEKSKDELEDEEDVEGFLESKGFGSKEVDSKPNEEEEDNVGKEGKDAERDGSDCQTRREIRGQWNSYEGSCWEKQHLERWQRVFTYVCSK